MILRFSKLPRRKTLLFNSLHKYSISESTQTVIVEFSTTVSRDELLKIKGVNKVQGIKQNKWIVEGNTNNDIRPEIFQFAVKHNYTVLSMQQKEMSLEQVFQELTK